MQRYLKLPVHLSARCALELSGLAHFVPLGKKQSLQLSTHNTVKVVIPNWFTEHFKDQMTLTLIQRNLFQDDALIGITKKRIEGIECDISTPERAILEVLDLVPQNMQYEHAYYLMEGLQTLRPTLVQDLLIKCSSIKVKRLFLHLAEKCNMPWLKRINTNKIVLGQGVRSITKGGCLDPKYQISVPKISEDSDYDE